MELGYTYSGILQVEKLRERRQKKKKKSPRSQQVMKTSPFLSQTQPWYNLTMLVKLKTRLFKRTTLWVRLRGPRKTEQCVSQLWKKKKKKKSTDSRGTRRTPFCDYTLEKWDYSAAISGFLPATVKALQGNTEHNDLRVKAFLFFSLPHYKLPLWAESQTDPRKIRANMLTDQWRQRVTPNLQRPSNVQQPQTHGLHLRAD